MRIKTLLLLTLLTFFSSQIFLSFSQEKESSKTTEKTTDNLILNNQTTKENGNKESQRTSDKTPNQADTSSKKESERKIIAYYFYGDVRCASCKKIEAYSYEAIQNGFKDEMENGLLEWKTINIDKKENKHFVDDYELYTRSLVIVEFKNGKQTRWKNLDMVWELLKDKKEFIEYVQNEVKDFIKEESK